MAPMFSKSFARSARKSLLPEKVSPAKAQSVAAFLKVFLCAFAPLREKIFPQKGLNHLH
jgi:hypothetical protein